jgi:hypothetical protein
MEQYNLDIDLTGYLIGMWETSNYLCHSFNWLSNK